MRSPLRRLGICAGLILLLLLCPVRPALANWETDYKAGKAAYEEGAPRAAARLLRAAIAKKKKEKANAIKASGMFFEPYLPHFYLGLTLFKLEKYDEALGELQVSESMKVIQKYEKLYSQLKQTRQLAEASAAARKVREEPEEPVQVATRQDPPPASSTPPATTPEPPATGSGSAEPAAGGGGAPGTEGPRTATPEPLTPSAPKPPPGPDPALVQARNAAAADLAAAAKLKVEGDQYLDAQEKSSLDTLSRELRSAENAAAAGAKHSELKQLIGRLDTKIADQKAAEARRAKEAEEQQQRIAANKALKDAVDRAAPTIRNAETFIRENGGSLRAAERTSLNNALSAVRNAKSPQAVSRGAGRLDSELGRVRKVLSDRNAGAVRTARQRYSSGARAYFEGRYDEAVPALTEAGAALGKEAGPRAFLGCALYKQYLLGREGDESLRQEAEKAFKAALAIDSRYSLDENTFPPKVIAFFRQVASGSSTR